MEPEEKIKQDFWYVLRKIKTEFLRTKKDEPIEYRVSFNIVGGEEPSGREEAQILEKVEEAGAIEILNHGGTEEYE